MNFVSNRNIISPCDKEVFFMKGYVTASGYMGYVENEYILFASEDDYFEYVDSLNF